MSVIKRMLLPIHVLGPGDAVFRVGQLVVGLALYGFSISLMIQASVGLSPWDVLSSGLVTKLPLSFGAITILISIVVLLLWIPLRQRLGLGTLLNAALVGPFADLGLLIVPAQDALWVRIPLFACGLLLLAIATGIYITADFGPGPRDGLMTGLVARTGRPIWQMRTLIEGSVLVIGWILGGLVGVGTLVFAFGVGPLIGLTLPWCEQLSARRRERYAARHGIADAVIPAPGGTAAH